jgi:hypothetical protein
MDRFSLGQVRMSPSHLVAVGAPVGKSARCEAGLR